MPSQSASPSRVKAGQIWRSPVDQIEYVVVDRVTPWSVKGDPPAARIQPVGLRRPVRAGIGHRVPRRDWTFIRDDAAELSIARTVIEEEPARAA